MQPEVIVVVAPEDQHAAGVGHAVKDFLRVNVPLKYIDRVLDMQFAPAACIEKQMMVAREFPTPPMTRHPRQGFTLLATLALILLLAAITLTLQARSQSQLRLFSRLTTDLHDRAAQEALTDRLRGLIADAMSSPTPSPNRPRLDGSPFAMAWGGRTWQVRVQDVEGLIDLYLAPPDMLALLPLDARALTAAASLSSA